MPSYLRQYQWLRDQGLGPASALRPGCNDVGPVGGAQHMRMGGKGSAPAHGWVGLSTCAWVSGAQHVRMGVGVHGFGGTWTRDRYTIWGLEREVLEQAHNLI